MLSKASPLILAIGLVACADRTQKAPPPRASSSAAPAASAPASSSAEPPSPTIRRRAKVREGGALARSIDETVLYVADEDRSQLLVVPLPADVNKPPSAIKMPGAPASVIALDGRLLVTIRDPGMLVILRANGASVTEEAKVPLPEDAWGVAVTEDERTAIVTSAWPHKVSAVDLDTGAKRWTTNVRREPRAVVVRPDGKSAYVTHLVGGAVSRIDGIDGGAANVRVSEVRLPVAPSSAPLPGKPNSFIIDGTLAYAAVLSPSGDRLFVPRHAIGAQMTSQWFGRGTVDVLLTDGDTPLSPDRAPHTAVFNGHPYGYDDRALIDESDGPVPLSAPIFIQPRAVAYRSSKATLIVAAEGSEELVELDARSIEPSQSVIRRYGLGGDQADVKARTKCGAPTGLALSNDEGYAWVLCRSTGDLAIVKLDPFDGKPFDASIVPIVHLADDPLPEPAARGRRLFYSAVDKVVSGGIGCAGCHPDGREDGHVWQEQPVPKGESRRNGILSGAPWRTFWHGGVAELGYPRQTPLLAGRVNAKSPYGWRGEQSSLEQRLTTGFGQHGGSGAWGTPATEQVSRAEALAAFLRKGLVRPPSEHRELTAEEQRGKAIFQSPETRCTSCHPSAADYTDRSVVSLGPALGLKGFLIEPDAPSFKTPSLLYAGGTPPYFHDGRYATLPELVDKINDTMGKTSHLSAGDKAALAAFLATIGVVDPTPIEPSPPAKLSLRGPLAPKEAPSAAPEEGLSVPEGTTPEPTFPEWSKAEEVKVGRGAGKCKVFRVREWLRVHCDEEFILRLALLVGSPKGVSFAQNRFGMGGDVMFPVRRGDRRLLEVIEMKSRSRYSIFSGPLAVVSEVWLPSWPRPVITLE